MIPDRPGLCQAYAFSSAASDTPGVIPGMSEVWQTILPNLLLLCTFSDICGLHIQHSGLFVNPNYETRWFCSQMKLLRVIQGQLLTLYENALP